MRPRDVRLAICATMALALLSSGCHDLYEADPLHAAQADSSAAGYHVGAPAPARALDQLAMRTQPSWPRATADVRTGPAADAGDHGTDSARAPSVASSDTATVTPAGGPLQVVAQADRTPPIGANTPTRPGADVATLPAELSAPPDDSVVVNTFLSYNPAARTVWVDLIAGFDGANGSLNFNGGFEGAHTLVVPVGWRVEARFQNRDRELSHSAIVVKAVDPIPMLAPPAAFPNAFTISLADGIIEGRTDVVRFSADTEGRYAILCAVPGHGQSGMWVRFDVTPGAVIPRYSRR